MKLTLAAISFVLWSLRASPAAETPLHICPSLPAAPALDGDLADDAWKAALQITDFRTTLGKEPAPAETVVSVGRHGEMLYFAARLSFRDGHEIRSFSKGDDDPGLWEDDSIEIFLAPDLRKPDYIQIIINSSGQVYDAKNPHPETSIAWNMTPRPEVKARVVGQQAHIEAAFPLKAFSPALPKEGDVWGLKLCRTFWDRREEGRKNTVFTSTMPGATDYHSRPYERLVFGEVTDDTKRFFAELDRQAPAAHPIHRLEEVARTKIWAKPYAKLFKDGRYQSERLIFHDTGTGAEIWRLTFDPFDDGVYYANVFPWNADGSWLMFGSRERLGGYWHVFLTGDGENVVSIPKSGGLAQPTWRKDVPDELLASSGRSLNAFNIRTGEIKEIARIPDGVAGHVSFDADGRYAAVCQQGFGEGGVVTVINLQTGESRRISLRTASQDFAGDWLYSSAIDYVKGAPHVGYSLNHLPHLSKEHQYQQWMMNLESGEYRQVRYLSHGGTSPLRDRKVGFSGGAIYLTDYFGDGQKFVMNIGTDGHIPWMSSPEWCVAGTSGSPGASAFASQLVQVYVDSGNWCRIAYGQTKNTTYGTHLFSNTSPDGTKVQYSSTMLGNREIYWAVMQRPEPPVRLRGTRQGKGVKLEWDRPKISKEYAGSRIWRSTQSGGPYLPVSGKDPIREFAWTDTDAPDVAYYVATSIEHSTLESRRFSNEVAPLEGSKDWPGKLRRYIEAEAGETTGAFAVNFHGSASGDRFIEHRHGEGQGSLTISADFPRSGQFHLWARVRAMEGAATVVAKAGDQSPKVTIASADWTWAEFDSLMSFHAGAATVKLESSSKGLGIDKLLLTDDPETKPVGYGDTELPKPSPVTKLAATAESPYEVRLAWDAPETPAIHHFNIRRLRQPGAAISQESLVASPSSAGHLDWGLDPGTAYEYAVTAVDVFGHESAEARATVTTPGIGERIVLSVEAESSTVEGGERKVVEDAEASGGANLQTPPEAVGSNYRLAVPFEVEKEGDYAVWLSAFPLADEHIYLRYAVDGQPPNAQMYLGSTRQGSTKHRLLWRPLGQVSGVTPTVWRLKPGRHQVEILHVGQPGYVGRFHAIDRFLITNDLSFTPPGPTWEWE